MENIQKAAPKDISEAAAPELKNRGLLLTGLNHRHALRSFGRYDRRNSNAAYRR